ncbi:MAG: ATP-binding cassette domain-containing protein [Myxococcota bacterium]|nr:ATP-binding cassette domain-containing protein [Myxococcota bacterium]MEC8380915.1 ATP-binding cassette domain-containing protein [Myxococcota bacterium]
MATVTFSNIHKSYGDTKVLKGIDFQVQDGEFLVLVGPSGCGKSTLLKCLAGLNEITSGEIVIGDKVVNDLPPRDRDVAMVFQSYALYPHMTVAENMGFALKLRKEPTAVIDKAVNEAAEMLDLTALLHRYPKELSGGQRQRVAMGRAIVRRPKVFLFDEPLSNLDAKLRNQLRLELKRLHQTLGTTMVYVTHDQVEAMTLADRIAVLNGGHLQQLGTPHELFHDPANRFVAGFIGSPAMCFLDGIEDGVVTGIRPHDVKVADQGEPATVEAVESMGFESFLHLQFKGQHLTARVEGRAPEKKDLKIQFAKQYRFDPMTGERLR